MVVASFLLLLLVELLLVDHLRNCFLLFLDMLLFETADEGSQELHYFLDLLVGPRLSPRRDELPAHRAFFFSTQRQKLVER